MVARLVLILSISAIAVFACWIVGLLFSLGKTTAEEEEMNGKLKEAAELEVNQPTFICQEDDENT